MKTFLIIFSLMLTLSFAQETKELKSPVNEFLSTPAPGAIYEIPIIIINYFPTKDGVHLDKEVSGTDMTIENMKKKLDSLNMRTKYALEEGSKFRGYNNPDAVPSIGYKVLDIFNFYEEMQRGYEVPWNEGWYRPDYHLILGRVNAEHYVNDLGVREIWIWGYHHGEIEPAESNMSSSLAGDISNSERNEEDLPIYDHSYTVYNYNFNRSQAEAIHNHGHQVEVLFNFAAEQQDGSSDLFWKDFVGRVSTNPDSFIVGRCGWTHMPPNTNKHYDYLNPAVVETDIEDWKPDGSGTKKPVSVETWKNLDYEWVHNNAPFTQKAESQFYIYWFQSLPGSENNIPHYDNGTMTNWWKYIGDFDNAVKENYGLWSK